MFNVKRNQWSFGELGLVDIPVNVVRLPRNNGWGIPTEAGAYWAWEDSRYGENPLAALRAASAFALTVGSLPVTEARLTLELFRKGRMVGTGVFGVFYRSGLKEAYYVILNGITVVVPYNRGRGFTEALRVASARRDTHGLASIAKLELHPLLDLP